ncbi:hypothetical protein F4775DRAFT_392563 [Biscogniauxia sp. FL1348]|nr:hypothetical protein F4775DRAFT_392563 [Biscogniauxia sp. FL1348]
MILLPFSLPFTLLLILLLHLPSPSLSAPSPIAASNPNPSINYTSLRCPPPSSPPSLLLPTPTYGTSGRAFGVCTSVVVRAPAPAVYAALLDFASYGSWNTFIVSVAVPAGVDTSAPGAVYAGMRMTLTSAGILGGEAGLNTTSQEVVTVVTGTETDNGGYLLAAWRYDDGLGGAGARAEHPTVLVDLGDGTTRMLSYETYYDGLFTGAIALLKDRLQERFETQALDLKAYVEGMV